jgi:pyruvate-ferredoxin/flavodoxin oxidoreductase
LFEDNAEYGLGIHLAQKYLRDGLIAKLETLAAGNEASASLKDAIAKFMETKDNTRANVAPTNALIAELEKCGCAASKEILDSKNYLGKKSTWIMGGDGWAYDIGFGGLDHVIASGEDVNILVFDTEMYSNTGGQASKASNIGEICQFAASGKAVGKKSLADIAMSYGYVYVAQIGLGANPAQTMKAIVEAEEYQGPSVIIAYSPCVNHGFNMENSQQEIKRAVASGYWNLYRYNPETDVFNLDSPAPTMEYEEFIMGESRYSALLKKNPEQAKQLFEKAKEDAIKRYNQLLTLANQNK